MSIDDAPTTFQPPEPSRGLHLYLKTLEVALDDERITLDEAIILSLVSRSLTSLQTLRQLNIVCR